MEYDKDQWVWWLGRLPGAWAVIAVSAGLIAFLAVAYQDGGPWALMFALATAMFAGVCTHAAWEGMRPWVTWDCPHCNYHDGDVDPRRLGRRSNYHLALNHMRARA